MKNPFKFYLLLFLILISLFSMVIFNYTKQHFYEQTMVSHQNQLHQTMQTHIEERQNIAITLAISLTENPLVQEVLLNASAADFNRRKLSALLNRMNQQTGFEELWLQVIDSEGDSVYRSWTSKFGDNLSNLRPEIKRMLATPKVKEVLSVGIFNLSFKAMVPIIDEQFGLLGIVELITRFTPLTEGLFNDRGVSSVLLVDKQFKNQLNKADPAAFLGDYLVANSDARSELLTLLQAQNLARILHSEGYIQHQGYVLNNLKLRDDAGRVLGHWITFTPKDHINFKQVSSLLQKYVVINVAVILLLLLITLLFIKNRQAHAEKRYFRQIIDSVSDIVYVANRKKIVDCNQHFFEFYDEFADIDAFLAKYTSICDTFVNEPGFIQTTMQGDYWIDYILKHPNESHKAKILRHGKAYIFQLKVKSMQGSKEWLFNVLMQDITEIEAFKARLQALTVTDELTGVGNRLACNQTLQREIERSHRYKTDFSIVLLDIDHFKSVNDKFGHDVGDEVLKAVAATIVKALRDIDSLCRFGGEEFMVLLPQTDKEAAFKIAERIRLAVSGLSSEDVPNRVTISCGVAHLNNWDTDKTFVKRADQALYRAKELGRDRVEIEQVEPLSEKKRPFLSRLS